MLIKEIKLRDYPYNSRKGLSERIVKNYFLKRGFEVFKGNYILGREFSSNYYLYENVQNKYRRFEQIMQTKLGKDINFVRQSVSKISGIPDFFVYRKLDGKMFFVEVKLENEQIKQRQYDCICFLETYGFDVYVFRVKKKLYKELSLFDFKNDRKVLIKQEKLRKRY